MTPVMSGRRGYIGTCVEIALDNTEPRPGLACCGRDQRRFVSGARGSWACESAGVCLARAAHGDSACSVGRWVPIIEGASSGNPPRAGGLGEKGLRSWDSEFALVGGSREQEARLVARWALR